MRGGWGDTCGELVGLEVGQHADLLQVEDGQHGVPVRAQRVSLGAVDVLSLGPALPYASTSRAGPLLSKLPGLRRQGNAGLP